MPVILRPNKPRGYISLPRPHWITRGLIGAWPMWAGGGTTLRDESGYKNHGTLTNGPVWVPGQSGFALSYTGASSQYVSIPDVARYAVGGRITALVWYNTTSLDVANIFGQWGRGTANDRSWQIGATAGGNFQVILSDDGTTAAGHLKNYTCSKVTSDGSWRSVGFTFGGGVLTIYADGVADTNPTKTTDDAITTLFNSVATPLMSGGNYNNGTPSADFLTGKVDCPFLWNRVLAPWEVMQFTKHSQRLLATLGRAA